MWSQFSAWNTLWNGAEILSKHPCRDTLERSFLASVGDAFANYLTCWHLRTQACSVLAQQFWQVLLSHRSAWSCRSSQLAGLCGKTKANKQATGFGTSPQSPSYYPLSVQLACSWCPTHIGALLPKICDSNNNPCEWEEITGVLGRVLGWRFIPWHPGGCCLPWHALAIQIMALLKLLHLLCQQLWVVSRVCPPSCRSPARPPLPRSRWSGWGSSSHAALLPWAFDSAAGLRKEWKKTSGLHFFLAECCLGIYFTTTIVMIIRGFRHSRYCFFNQLFTKLLRGR